METTADAAPIVSVVIPTYNRAHLVRRALAGVLAQTFSDFECIVVDDGSTDDTFKVVRGFQDPRVRLEQLADNLGCSRARNWGIKSARGEFVAFLDSDDEWLPRKLELQVERLCQNRDPRIAVVYCSCFAHDGLTGRTMLRRIGAMHEGDVFEHLLRGWHPRTPSVFMVKRSSLSEIGGFDETLSSAADYDMWLLLAQASNYFVAVREALVIKHDNAGPQISDDLTIQYREPEVMDRKWGPVVMDRLGTTAYRRWQARRYAKIQLSQLKRVRYAMAGGQRMMAWRHWLAMCRVLPRSRRYFMQALALLLLGPTMSARLGRAKDALLGHREAPPTLVG